MKKFFLIPLMTLVCSVMAWGEIRTAGTFAEMQSAISEAAAGDVIQLTADFTATSSTNINKSISIDGQNHKITGDVGDNGIFKLQGTSDNQLLVAIENVKIDNAPKSGANVILYLNGYIDSLAIDHCELICSKNSGNPKPIEYRGTQLQAAKIGIHNSHLYGNTSGYAYRAYNPAILHIDNSQIEGFGCLNFQYPRLDGELGARGTQVYAKNCNFDSPNVHSGGWNSFMAFNFADDGISIELDNCGMNAEVLGNQGQAIFGTNGWNLISRRTEDINIVIKGDNSYINGTFMDPGFIVNYNGDYDDVWENGFWSTYPGDAWWEAHPEANDFTYFYHEDYNLETGYDPSANFTSQNTADINLTITGGTYSVNPNEYKFKMHVATEDPTTHMPLTWTQKGITIPDGYEVKTIETQQGGLQTTLYRVRKTITTSYEINQNVEGEGDGLNKNTEFVISGSTTDQTLTVDSVVAHYVEVSDNATLTIPEGKTLEVTNGLDVAEGAQVVVEAGSTLKVGEGGVVAETTESIVIEANENGAASFLLDPEVVVNTTPNLTVRMTAKNIGRDANNDYFWHRFAMPVASITSWDKEGGLGEGNDKYPTYLYAWDYTNNAWENIAPNAMVPLQGYTLTLASEYIDGSAPDGHLNVLQDVTYIFKGNLVGNEDAPLSFQHEGFNYFGNSYTGYMHVKTVLQGIADENIDATAYMWCNDPTSENYQTYVGTSLYKLIKNRGLEEWQKEVSPMQTFILRLRGAETANEEVNYAAAIWGNPRYGNNSGASLAPRRRVAEVNEDTYLEIAVKAANGKSSSVDFTEAAGNSDAFESGYDVEKYMNEKTINLYATVNGLNLSSVVTNNIEGKTLSLKTNDEIAYTMSFKNVEGAEFAIRDNVTNQVIAIEEGTTYEFAAQPNSVVEGRFEIIPVAKMPTAIENTEVKSNVKGIYTIMGQYLGEDFDILPAGVYVVDGVKIVK